MTIKNTIWKQILDDLESKLGRDEIKTWFSQSSCDRLDDNLAVIKVKNKFVASWLKDQHVREIQNSIKKITNKKPDIVFINRETEQDNKKSAEKSTKYLNYFNNSLDKSMSFENYITNEFNRFACSSAKDISENPGTHYNPFYIFSKYSIGKTHLLNAIGNYIFKNNKELNILYIHCKNFISDFNYASRIKNFNNFKIKYNNPNILLFDDIHYLSNALKCQEAFINIFDRAYSSNKQIVITGDYPPGNMKIQNDHLTSRIGSGLVAEIKEPDLETKSDLLKKYVENNRLSIPDDIINFLTKINSDIKTLLKNIVRVETYMSMNRGKLNISRIKSLIKERYDSGIGIKDIQSVISGYFNITVTDMLSDRKNSKYSYPRHMAMYLSRNYLNIPLKEIGFNFGDRDHSTVLYACKKMEKLLSEKKEIVDDLNNLKSLII